MFIVEVIPITKGLKNPSLTYFTAKDVNLGGLVSVPLRSRDVLAIVIRKEPVLDMRSLVRNASFELRNIHTIHDFHITSPAFIAGAHAVANMHALAPGRVLAQLLPKAILDNPESFKKSNEKQECRDTNEGYLLQRTQNDRITYYKTRAREILGESSSLVIVCPTIAQAKLVFESVSSGIENCSFLVHGKVSKKKLLEIASKTNDGGSYFLVGTPSVIALAPTNTSEYVIEQSSSNSYMSVQTPYIDMRIAVVYQARHAGARYLYADNPVEVQLWEQVNQGIIDTIEPVHRKVINTERLQIISFRGGKELQSESDRIQELSFTKSKFQPLHYQLVDVIKNDIKHNKQIFCYVARKGLAPNIVCNECGQIARSPSSNLPYSLFTKTKKDGGTENVYVCASTGEQVPAHHTCQFCSGTKLERLGIGTDGFARTLSEHFPTTKIVVLDRSHLNSAKKIREVLELHQSKEPVIWIGTSFGYELLPSFDTSIIISLAPHFAQPSYTNEEQVLQTIIRIQEKTQGITYVQDRQNISELLPVLVEGMHPNFIRNELRLRKELSYPPFTTLVSIEFTVTKPQLAKRYHELESLFQDYSPSILVHPSSQKSMVLLVVLLNLPLKLWSVTFQDPKLKELFLELGKQANLRFNPRDFVIQ